MERSNEDRPGHDEAGQGEEGARPSIGREVKASRLDRAQDVALKHLRGTFHRPRFTSLIDDTVQPRELRLAVRLFRDVAVKLGAEHVDDYVTIDVGTRRYVVGASRDGAAEAFEARFGKASTFTFHIGTEAWKADPLADLECELRHAIKHFRRIEGSIEADHSDAYITIDVDTGNYVIGPTGLAASKRFREKFGGARRTFTGHIGSM